MKHEQHAHARAADGGAGGRRHRRAGRRPDRGAPPTREDLGRARNPGIGARWRRSAASAPARGCSQGHQRAVRDHSRRASGDRQEGGGRGREETPMTLWWIGDILLLVVVLPIVLYLLRGVLDAARSIVPSVQKIAIVAAAGSKDLDAAPLLLTTQDQVAQTVAGVANYGGSLDVILDDAEPEG